MANKHRFQQTDEFKGAARRFLVGFWETEDNKRMMKFTMGAMWERYKQNLKYESLRQALSDAAKANGRAWED